jgi:hypothetical protein
MVEIALCIAIVAFAMVAIVGVLPTGMTVQKDNREDTVINQEGQYWLEILKGGNRGVTDLTNYVEQITISNRVRRLDFPNIRGNPISTNADIIVGLLSKPKFESVPSPGGGKNLMVTNKITARVKALTGLASEKGPLTNEFSFRYELQVENVEVTTVPQNVIDDLHVAWLKLDAWLRDSTKPRPTDAEVVNAREYTRVTHLLVNQQQIRLIMRWPLYERGTNWVPGLNRKTFQATIAGAPKPDSGLLPNVTTYHFQQNRFLVNAMP